MLKKILTFIVAGSLLCAFGVPAAFADGDPEAVPAGGGGYAQAATEYPAADLFDPIAAETAAPPAAPGATPQVNAKSAILMEVSTGNILMTQNADEKVSPASITKIMSILLIVEALDSGKIGMDDVVTCSAHAAGMGGSQIWLEPGETMTVHELLKATVIGSANDATTALAEHVAGSEETFVSLMNQRAAELGMNDTHFQNCAGLDTDGHYTTAHDVAVMSRELISHPIIKEYSGIWIDSLRGGATQLVNTNKLVRFYDGCTGLKTGTTSQAGSCLSATALKNGMELVAVVMNAPTSDDRFNGARKLLDYGFANWSRVMLEISDEELQPVKVLRGTQPYIGLKKITLDSVLVPKGKEKNVEKSIELAGDVMAPVLDGQVLCKVTLSLEGTIIGEAQLLADGAVQKLTVSRALARLLNALFKR